ncbi:MAG: PP2C family serine/threonine-protein phosphatase [Polyangiaceae bacterium]
MIASVPTTLLEGTWPELCPPPPEGETSDTPLMTRAFGLTDRGRVRPNNQDQFLVASPAAALWIQQSSGQPAGVQYADIGSHLFVVADGMGGHAGGAEASALAVNAVETSLLSTLGWLLALRSTTPAPKVDVLGEMRTALHAADARVCEEASRHPELAGMGTTLTAAYRYGSSLYIAHAGDSRCYLLRDEQLYRLTQDHTIASELVRQGVLQSEADARPPLRHIVTNIVGGPKEGVKVEVHRVGLASGDVILLCTDGLTGMLTDLQLASILRTLRDPREACERLVRAANDAGGSDNITAIVARVEQTPEPDSPEV